MIHRNQIQMKFSSDRYKIWRKMCCVIYRSSEVRKGVYCNYNNRLAVKCTWKMIILTISVHVLSNSCDVKMSHIIYSLYYNAYWWEIKILIVPIFIQVYISNSLLRVAITNVRRGVKRCGEKGMTNDIIGWHGATMAKSITVITSKLDLGEFRLPPGFASTG